MIINVTANNLIYADFFSTKDANILIYHQSPLKNFDLVEVWFQSLDLKPAQCFLEDTVTNTILFKPALVWSFSLCSCFRQSPLRKEIMPFWLLRAKLIRSPVFSLSLIEMDMYVLCMCVCICVCIFVCGIYVCMCIHTYTDIYTCVYIL